MFTTNSSDSLWLETYILTLEWCISLWQESAVRHCGKWFLKRRFKHFFWSIYNRFTWLGWLAKSVLNFYKNVVQELYWYRFLSSLDLIYFIQEVSTVQGQAGKIQVHQANLLVMKLLPSLRRKLCNEKSQFR